MSQIIIVDDNRSTGVFLKKAMECEGYKVIRVPYEEDAIYRFKVGETKLVMINRTCREDSGWEIFNHVKLFYPEIPLMLYFLDNFRVADAAGVIQAVEPALRHEARTSLRTATGRLPGYSAVFISPPTP